MRGTAIAVGLFFVAIVAVGVSAGIGYSRLQKDQQKISDAALSETSPGLQAGRFDALYLKETQLLADRGDAAAMTVLGARYQYGQGMPVNMRLMLTNYQAAANKGNSTAQLMLGCLHDEFILCSVPMSYNEQTASAEIKDENGATLIAQKSADAYEWYGKAAKQGNANAEVMLGNLYEKEIRADPQNIIKAGEWFRKAAEQGNSVGALKLGQMYVGDYGVPKDEDKGIEWLKKSAAAGNVDAELSLGIEYQFGNAMTRGNQEAAKWYLLAAQHGNTFAQRDIGMFYAKGTGVPRDYIEAYVWLNKAAAHDAPEAAETRNGLELLMTRAQLEEAQRRASQPTP